MQFGQNVKAVFSYLVALAVIGALSTSLAFAQGRDFNGQNLNNKNFEGQALNGANFSGATLVGTNFRNASLKGAKFDGAQMQNTNLNNADLTGADMRNMFGVPPIFYTHNTNFTQVNMEGLDLKGSAFYGVNFSNANLRGTINWDQIGFNNFRGADLRGANLRSAPDQRGSTEGRFFGAVYDDQTIWPEWFDVVKSGARKAP